MRAHALQPGILHGRVDLRCIVTEKSRRLHFRVAQRRNLLQRSLVVLGKLFPHRIQLQTNRPNQTAEGQKSPSLQHHRPDSSSGRCPRKKGAS